VEAGLQRFWEQCRALPKAEQPFDATAYEVGDADGVLREQAMAIYRQRNTGP
jgi:hypothetical protein